MRGFHFALGITHTSTPPGVGGGGVSVNIHCRFDLPDELKA